MTMLTTNSAGRAQYEARGYVVVTERHPGIFKMRRRDEACLRPMRGGACGLDQGHRGRCTTSVFYCDACHQHRPGRPAAHDYDTNGDASTAFCFFCVRRPQRATWWDGVLVPDLTRTRP